MQYYYPDIPSHSLYNLSLNVHVVLLFNLCEIELLLHII